MAKVLRITARRAGFRRAGIAHPAEPVDHPIGRFTDKQRGALEAEPLLIVEEVDLGPSAEEKAAAEAKAAADRKAAEEKAAAEANAAADRKAAEEKAAPDRKAAAEVEAAEKAAKAAAKKAAADRKNDGKQSS